ncbi:sensor histidine kinase [Ramlibacter rhizophilus]|uniref:Sensor histidine kinase n=1 Tax=Ramlibacter rhizophilus TaxID=1781167 RepID=A0A4Z0BIA5_9BURK|nr:histidine kinase [Ramlibacter rhizophilus]TFY98451.1 sensor histidine kinase [Ramlibacter rhizophilus]
MKTLASHEIPAASAGRLHWPVKLRHFLLVLVFCLGIAVLNVAFSPDKSFVVSTTYSLAIGLATWSLIDFGRHAFPSSAQTGWPTGLQGVLLVAAGVALGWAAGEFAASHLLQLFGWSEGSAAGAGAMPRSLLISVVAGVAGSYYFYNRGRREWLVREMEQARRHAAESRLKLLEAQLEPHMLFNTLANLRALIGVDPPRAQQMLDHMIAYLRATLEASRATRHPLSAEFERLRDYLALMQVRMGARLSYALELPAALASHPIPALLLQPLVENSIRHGLEPKLEGGRIEVRAWREGDALLLQVDDTGLGAAVPSEASGFGLTQVRERLDALYAGRAGLQLAAHPEGGMRATVRLPWQP